jgi:hypothetical protein
VYGLRVTAQESIVTLFERDVVIGPDIEDERSAESNLRDDEITYDFIGADPDTLQPRLFIPRDVTGEQFRLAFDSLDDGLREVTPMTAGQGGSSMPFSVVPRNAGLKVTFSAPLGLDESFFVERDAQGAITGLRNTEAVQLLAIEGDPEQPGAFVPIPVRVVPRGRHLILDPVLLGVEGLQYQSVNNASGLPASPDSLGANIRVALALEGPLALPRLREAEQDLTGSDNSGRRAIVRDFRSGNEGDTSSDLARGFVRDALPLRIIGEIVMYLEKVEAVNEFTQEITVFKNGLTHEIDRSDVFRFIRANDGILGPTEVVVDPDDDRGQPDTQHVRVRIRRIEGLENIDPRGLPGYPSSLSEREPWLVANAPRAICIAEFAAGGATGRDDPRNFITFSPQPLVVNGVRPAPNEFVSPFASAVVRFTKPIDIATAKWADTFFFAMRDLTTSSSIEEFILSRQNEAGDGLGMNPSTFDVAKYRTPYLVTARVLDEDGSQTSLRLQPTTGFYLDETMRNPPAGADYRYFLHLISQSVEGGIRDLAGNVLDLQGTTADRSSSVVIPFTVDTRMNGGEPLFADNLSISVVRRFASRDEDANPSYFLANEVLSPNSPQKAAAYPLEDLFGGFIYIDGKLQARPTTRSRVIADNLNQSPVVQNTPITPTLLPPNPLAWCPQNVAIGTNEGQIGANSSTSVLNAGIQNPLNPYGCRLQTVWREVDLSLSRTDPFDFNLDIEQMYWAPFTGTNLSFDEFDRVSLWLGHSEYRPIPCVGDFSSLASLPGSGLREQFDRNFAFNPQPTGTSDTTVPVETQSPRRAAYVDAPMTINPSDVVYEPNGVNRFLPLPTFQKPYFVYRDETVIEQGGRSDDTSGSDSADTAYFPYIVSPFNMGQGRRWIDRPGTGGAASSVNFVNGYWNDARSRRLSNTPDTTADFFTGGLVGNIALPLLADFWTYCDSSELPAGGGYVAFGTNGWQIAVTVQSGPQPNFRVLSAGRAALPNGSPPICRGPSDTAWSSAAGGFAIGPPPTTTPAGDNTFYWIMMDVLKRQSVITNGFIDLNNPHRVPEGFADPRLGPFYLSNGSSTLPANVRPSFSYEFDPPLSQLQQGTSIVPQFRGASVVDPTPWYWNAWMSAATKLYPNPTPPGLPGYTPEMRAQLRPSAANFPLDPYKAGDAHMRKWDTRTVPGGTQARNWWTYLYNRTVTSYVEDPNQVVDPGFTAQFAGPNESFVPRDVRYFNWRFVTGNNADANPPVAPTIETFALSYRFVRVQ